MLKRLRARAHQLNAVKPTATRQIEVIKNMVDIPCPQSSKMRNAFPSVEHVYVRIVFALINLSRISNAYVEFHLK